MGNIYTEGKTFIIAEISANHGGKLEKAVKMIREARRAGADAVKFQTYTPDGITLNCHNRYFQIKHPKWGGRTLYQLYQEAYTPWNWFKKLKAVCDSEGIFFFSTAFDREAVDFLESLNVKLHKIASFEAVDIPLIEYMASKGKPMIISTGMATLREMREAVAAVRKYGVKDLTLLKCVSCYPADPGEMNLKTMQDMRHKLKVPVGLSDHTPGHAVAVAATALGARVIEKHFISSRKDKTPDSFFSMEPEEFRLLVENVRIAEQAVGSVFYGPTKKQTKSLVFRRSLFVSKDTPKGEILTEANIRSVRPSHGLPPKFWSRVIGKKAKRNLKAGQPLKLEDLS